MWEAISTVFSGGNAFLALAGILILVAVFGAYVKLGIISIRKKGFQAGRFAPDRERGMLRRQAEYVRKYCLALEPQLRTIFRKKEFRAGGEDAFYYKYLSCLMANEVENWVLSNNVTQSAGYIEQKKNEMKTFLASAVGKCDFSEAALERKVGAWVTEIIQHIILMRKNAG